MFSLLFFGQHWCTQEPNEKEACREKEKGCESFPEN